MVTVARFWPQRWLAVRKMLQDLIRCWNQRKLKALILRVVVFVNDPPSAERRIDFAVVFTMLWSYGRKICLNTRHGYSESSDGCHIFSGFVLFAELMWVYRNVSVSASCWPRTRCLLIYQQTSENQSTVHLKTCFIWKFSREWLLWTGCTSGGSLRKKPQSPTEKY